VTQSINNRLQSLDWEEIGQSLWADGHAVTPPILTAEECGELIHLYEDESRFRSKVVMARLGFGKGEYKYFKSPLPELVAELRQSSYPHLSALANRWAEEFGSRSFPVEFSDFLKICHTAGQKKPTPLLLKYEAGDYNCLHQDLYGEVAFPFQMTFILSRPGDDFVGGEFVLVEQRPRMQSRAMVVGAAQGQGILFPTRHRTVRGTRGIYKTNLRHGVSRVQAGRRFTLGIIFHDAA
jgi:hypothetical protein